MRLVPIDYAPLSGGRKITYVSLNAVAMIEDTTRDRGFQSFRVVTLSGYWLFEGRGSAGLLAERLGFNLASRKEIGVE